jgi:isopentenyldiphosphate isomerase
VVEEIVDLVDEDGRVTGSAPRSVVRRDNLLHSATAVLVRDPGGRIYLHRRTFTKDWAPGHWDAAAGGVIAAGEVPAESALRELEEELGISADDLVELGRNLYQDETIRCLEYVFEARWSGPVRHQPEEVAEGRWVTLAELGDVLADSSVRFVPDTRQLLTRLAHDGVADYAALAPGGPARMER